MPAWRLLLLSVLLTTTWMGCTDDPDPVPDGGTTVDSGTNPADSGSDAGTNPSDSGTDAGTNPADSGTDPVDSGTDGGTDPADGGVDGGSSEIDAGTDAGPSGTSVRIRRFRRYLTAGGYEERPEDFTQNPVQLFVVEGGTLVPVSGMAGGPGEYVFPNVPRTPYYVEVDGAFVVTDASDLDLSINLLGRADARPTEPYPDMGHQAGVELAGLEPWRAAGSSLLLVSGELDFAGPVFLNTPEEGDVSIRDFAPFTSHTGPVPVFERARGDRAWVLQQGLRELALPDGGAASYATTVRALHLPPFSYNGTSEAPLPVRGTLQELRMNELPLDWRVPDFAALAAEVHPGATYRFASFLLEPAAHGPPEGWVGWSGDLVSIIRSRGDASAVQGTLLYGNPFPSNWGLVASASSNYTVNVVFPEDGRTYPLGAAISVVDRAAEISAGPVVPRIRPPRELALDGTPAYGPRTLSLAEHTVSWAPPASGVPDAYRLSVRRLETLNTTQLLALTVGSIYVDGRSTSAVLPSRLLEPGRHYVLLVEAVRAEGFDVSVRPLMLIDRDNLSRAPTITGVLSVPARGP